MQLRIPYLLVGILALTLSGCSYNCHFEARGVIRNAVDGQPIENARVELFNADGRPLIHASGKETSVTTDSSGQFQVSFCTVPTAKDELTGWTAKLSAEGYEPETIEIGPVKEPKGGNVTVYLIFHASLRKAR